MGNDLTNKRIPSSPSPKNSGAEVPFGVNEVRLNARQWLAAFALVLLIVLVVPLVWEKVERFNTGLDYRIPYSLSKDYWLYRRWLRQPTNPNQIVVLGDSVVWGEYVLPDGTLSHFLNREAAQPNKYINGGVNGLFPLALEGLVKHYGGALHNRKVVVHCNVLWMSNPKADLQTEKEEKFNHSALVPQFSPRIPCYRADANERLSAIVERNVPFVTWVGHLQNAYFGQKSILSWTRQDDGGDPPQFPNTYRNPLAQIKMTVPSAPKDDPQRGPKSPRHKPWSADGNGTTHFDWVGLDTSLQWGAFQRLIKTLRERGNEVLVVLGPFNEHIMAGENVPAYRRLRDGISAWLNETHVSHITPEALPSPLYADASHPLTEGYELLAKRIYQNGVFQKWVKN